MFKLEENKIYSLYVTDSKVYTVIDNSEVFVCNVEVLEKIGEEIDFQFERNNNYIVKYPIISNCVFDQNVKYGISLFNTGCQQLIKNSE